MKLFITGIGTNVGKTITSAIITESLQADYWKPIQAGDLENSDTIKVKNLVSNNKSIFHPSSYELKSALSPHYAASIDGIEIDLKKINEPKTNNHLVIEGAGGILVPINGNATIIDLIQNDYKVIIVSQHYLGSINHTLMTCEVLKSKGIKVAGIVFSGDENKATEDIILQKTNIKCIGRIQYEPYFDKNVILDYATHFRENLVDL